MNGIERRKASNLFKPKGLLQPFKRQKREGIRKRALSLIEMMVVLILALTVLPLAFFSLQDAYKNYRHKQLVERIKNYYQSAAWLAELFNNEVQLLLLQTSKGQSLVLQSAAFSQDTLRQHFQKPLPLPEGAVCRFENGSEAISFLPGYTIPSGRTTFGKSGSTTPDFLIDDIAVSISITSKIVSSAVPIPDEIQQLIHLPTS